MSLPRTAYLVIIPLALLGALLAFAGKPNQPDPVSTFASPYVDAQGSISFPLDYRLKWTHLGSWSVTEPGGDQGMHDVYAQPGAVAEFRASGSWPDGAMIIKEVRASQGDKLTTGDVRWDAKVNVWFVMIKDSKKSFPDNPNWGRGWGWALFNHDDPAKNVSTNYKLDCLACHLPAQHTDLIYQQGYPTLNEREGPAKSYPPETYQPPSE